MISISQFDRVPTSLRPVILVVVFGIGVVAMRHFVEDVAPHYGFLTPKPNSGAGRYKTPAIPTPPNASPSQVKESPKHTETVSGASASGAAPPAALRKDSKPDLPAPQSGDLKRAPSGKAAEVKQPRDEAAGGSAQGSTPLPESLKSLLSLTRLPNLVVKPEGRFIVTEPILFNTGLAKLRESSLRPLDRLARVLIDHPEIRMNIIGYTDNLGVESTNEKISADRAAAVLDYLVSRGVEAGRLQSSGMGSKNPIAPNDTQLGRQANRRIEFLVTSPK